ncbi:MAG: type II toxin-antitoxin system ParD family antitoxin [Planctomycetes bacterium]|nr:type II toxin-antitoxin system ParD family antitoxin [Planctomycetota bacterium]
MNLELPVEQQTFIAGLVESGRFASAREAISEAVRLLVSHERLKQEIQVGIQQAEHGDLSNHDTVFGQLRTMTAAALQGENGH